MTDADAAGSTSDWTQFTSIDYSASSSGSEGSAIGLHQEDFKQSLLDLLDDQRIDHYHGYQTDPAYPLGNVLAMQTPQNCTINNTNAGPSLVPPCPSLHALECTTFETHCGLAHAQPKMTLYDNAAFNPYVYSQVDHEWSTPQIPTLDQQKLSDQQRSSLPFLLPTLESQGEHPAYQCRADTSNSTPASQGGSVQFRCRARGCQRVYAASKSLLRHTREDHLAVKVACPWAGCRYARVKLKARSMVRHMRRAHGGNAPITSVSY